jgi:hypothetical protein
MTNNTLRIRQFKAWKDALSARQTKVRNQFHESSDAQMKKPHEASLSAKASAARLLADELSAWDAASDEAFDGLEESLG